MQEISPLAFTSATVIDLWPTTKGDERITRTEGLGRATNIKAFVIHLERSRQRAPQVAKLIADLPVRGEIISAVDGNDLTSEEIGKVYRPRLHKPAYPFALSKFEIACFLSHRKAWTAIVEQGLDAGFIVEDDVALEDSFVDAFSAACACLAPGDFIRFPFRSNRETGETVFAKQGVRLIQPTRIGLGMVAQLVTREAAMRLLKATESFDRPVDTMVQMDWLLHLSPLTVLPGGVAEISSSLGGSSIKRKASLKHKLMREIFRPIYRAKVALYSHLSA